MNSKSNLSLVVMAAGMGSRYGGIKQLASFGPNAETLLEYSVFDAHRAGFETIIFVIRKEIEDAFRDVVLQRFPPNIRVELAFQELAALPVGYQAPADRKKPWGTGHAVLMAKPFIEGPFAVINADDFYGPSAFQLLADHLRQATDNATYGMVGYALEKTLSEHGSVSRGICELNAEQQLVQLVEHTNIYVHEDKIVSELANGEHHVFTGNEKVSMNLWGFPQSFLQSLDQQFGEFLHESVHSLKSEFYLPFAVNHDLTAGKARVQVLPTDEQWYGVTYPDDLAHVQAALRTYVERGTYPEHLWSA
jgi:NDP-sugar pyrophosphorylase family protein